MKTITKTEIYNALPDQVFKAIDDLGITGMHMTNSSAMMMGSKLKFEFLTKKHSGLGSKYRWKGIMIGMFMDFTVEVTKWLPGIEKVWMTIGEPRLIIYSWYRMKLLITALPDLTSQAELSITYEKPRELWNKILSIFFADWYCRWCLGKMLGDAGISLKSSEHLEILIANN